MSRSVKDLTARHPRAKSIALFIVAAVAITAFLTNISFHTVGGNSDGATVVLEGSSLAHGNLLLHGWILSQDSFWTIDALFYATGVAILGIHGYLLHLVPALIAALITLIGCKIASTNNGDAFRPIAIVVVVAGLCFPVAAWAQFYLAGPYHLGTVLLCLAAFYLYATHSSRTGYLLATIALVAGILGDLQTLSLGVIPLAIAGLVAMARTWSWRAGSSALVISTTATVAALVVRKIAQLIGTFTFAPARAPATLSAGLANVIPGLHYATNLLGVGSGPFGSGPIPTELSFAYVAELVVICGAFVAGIAAMALGLVTEDRDSNREWVFDDLLVLGALGSISTYAYLATTGSDAEARYLSAGIIFVIILTARRIARFATRIPVKLSRLGAGIGGLVVAGIVTGAIFTSTSALPVQPASDLVALLRHHGLTRGIGGYWSASITTVLSDGDITVRPVIAGPDGKIVRYARESLDSWYQNADPTFLVYDANTAIDAITRKSARATFGPAEHVYAIGPYRVLVYRHPVRVGTHGYSA